MADQLTIRIPPAIPYIALLRAMASGLGARLNLTYDRIMDLHIAIDELCSRLLATTESPSSIEFSFLIEEDGLSIEATADGPVREDREFLNAWSKQILGALVDRLDVQLRDGRRRVALELKSVAL